MSREPLARGELPGFARRTLGLFTRRRFSYDRLVRVRPGSRRYLLANPDDVRHVLTSTAEAYRKTPRIASERGRERVGEGLLSSAGEAHRDRRRLLQPLFHRRAVSDREPEILTVVEEWSERRAPGERIDLASEMAGLTRAAILRILFGGEARGETGHDLSGAIAVRRRYTEHLYHGRLPFRDRIPTPLARAHRRAVDLLDEAIYGAIRRRRRAGGRGSGDLISDLVDLEDREGRRLSDRDVRDEVLTFTSTGYETLGEMLAWTWYLLAGHPEIERSVHAEIDSVDEGAAGGTTFDGSLVERVLDESLRLYPPTWIYRKLPSARLTSVPCKA